jgi:hypothetical protein
LIGDITSKKYLWRVMLLLMSAKYYQYKQECVMWGLFAYFSTKKSDDPLFPKSLKVTHSSLFQTILQVFTRISAQYQLQSMRLAILTQLALSEVLKTLTRMQVWSI